MSDQSQGPGWWQASDGKWYPPEQHPDATRVTPESSLDETGPVDPGSPPSAGDDYPMTPPAHPPTQAPLTPPGAPPAAPPGAPPTDGGGGGTGKAPIVIAVILGVLILAVFGSILAITFLGDEPDEEVETADDSATDAEALEGASDDYLTALLAGDASSAYRYLSADCKSEVDEGDFSAEVDEILDSLDDAGFDPDDIELDEVDVDVEGGEGTALATFDGPDDFDTIGVPQVARTWTVDGGEWTVPDCDGRIGSWYTADEDGFVVANTEFANATFQGEFGGTYAFLSEDCRDDIDEDDYVDDLESGFALIESLGGIELSDITVTGFTDVEIDGDEGSGVAELDVPDDILDDADGGDFAFDDLDDPETSSSVYEGAIWRTLDCEDFGETTFDDDSTPNTTPSPTFDDSTDIPSDVVPLGEVGVVGNWEIRVVGFEEDADATILADPANLDPLDGYQYSLVTVEATYVGEGTSTPFDLTFVGVTDLGEFSQAESICGSAVPDELDTSVAVASGETVSGSICLEMETGAASSAQLLVEDFFAGRTVLFSLR